jgi:hypothetical protein
MMEQFSPLNSNGRSLGAASKFFQLCTCLKPKNLRSRIALRNYKCNNMDRQLPQKIPCKRARSRSVRFFGWSRNSRNSHSAPPAAELPRQI